MRPAGEDVLGHANHLSRSEFSSPTLALLSTLVDLNPSICLSAELSVVVFYEILTRLN